MKTISCMNIDVNLLHSMGAEDKLYRAKEMVFREGDYVFYYFQIVHGRIKLNTYSEEGKEFIHNILGKDQSFGDPFLFLEKCYPMNAICMEPTELVRLPKHNFIDMITQYPELSLEMNMCFSQQMYYKMMIMQSMSSQNPVKRLQGIMDYLKSFSNEDCAHCFEVELTRQQLANLTGLRVETVIRTLKKMDSEGGVLLKNRRILY